MSDKIGTPLSRHILEEMRRIKGATGEFTLLFNQIAFAAKIVSREVNKAGLVNILGFTGETNVSGDEVKKLDVYANETFIKALDHVGHLCVMASEENKTIIEIPDKYPQGKYVFVFDPLDGSSNIDVNATIGTIFGIYRRVTPEGTKGTLEDVLQKGDNLVCGGYVLYGSSTMLVYTTGNGVHGFTLDPSVGEFLLSHPDIKVPKRGNIYSVNEGNYNLWDENMRKYIDYLKSDKNANGKPYKMRYIGSLVADFHRTLIYGGIFLYPADKKNPNGKLRLIYEANPLAFIIEQASGRASDGKRRIREIQPEDLHQRTPLIIGSEEDVLEAEAFLRGEKQPV